MSEKEVPLVDAAARTGRTWSQMWQLVLTRKVKGRKRDRRWFVDTDSLRTYEATVERGKADSDAA